MESVEVNFGKHCGMSIGALMLNEPKYAYDYVLKAKSPEGPLIILRQQVVALVHTFNAKPLLRCCEGRCGRKATCGMGRKGVLSMSWWCDHCDAHRNLSVRPGMLKYVASYQEALEYANSCTRSNLGWSRVVRQLARAKGLPERMTEKAVLEFFYDL
nr:hypothetical protein [uncultured Roseateles sp.]